MGSFAIFQGESGFPVPPPPRSPPSGFAHGQDNASIVLFSDTIFPDMVHAKEMQFMFMGRNVPVTYKWLCSENASLEGTGPRCHCDLECILFGDCCVDAFEMSLNINHHRELVDALIDPITVYTTANPLSFESFYLSLYLDFSGCHQLKVNNTNIAIAMIDKCPENNSTDLDELLEHKCLNTSACFLSTIPATFAFSKTWQVVFRNVYCALCHGLEKDDILLWEAYEECPDNFDLKGMRHPEDIKFSSCIGVYRPQPNTGNLRKCFLEHDLKSNCKSQKDIPEQQDDILACPNYIAPVKFNYIPYKNIHCAYCNKHVATKYDKFKAILDVYVDPFYQYNIAPTVSSNLRPTVMQQGLIPTWISGGAIPIPKQPTMKVLFDFSFQAGFMFNIDGKSDSHAVQGKACGDKAFYDYISTSCRTIICPFGRHWIDGMCKYERIVYIDDPSLFPTSERDNTLCLSIVAEMRTKTNVTERLAESFLHRLREVVEKYRKGKVDIIDDQPLKLMLVSENQSADSSDPGNMTVISEIHFKKRHDIELYEVIQYIIKFRKLISIGRMNSRVDIISVSLSNRDLVEAYRCIDDRHLKRLTELAFDKQNKTVYLTDTNANTAFRAENTRFTFSFSPKSSTPNVYDISICSHLRCPQMKLSDSEFTFSNGSLQLIPSGEHLSPDLYEIRNDSVYLCIPQPGKRFINPYSKFLYSSQLIQRITYILSLTALGLTILIYIKSASVRTLHGKTLVSLSASLIGAQIMGLLQNESGDVWCKIVAIIMHFSWLAAFGWMSMISYDMTRTFFRRQTRITDTHAERKRYLAYSIIGWLIPGLIVTTCIILDNVDVSEVVQIGYGKNGYCFISGTRALFIFFSIPFTTSVIFNTTAFILTVYGISTKRRTNLNSKRSNDRLYSLIYLKLSVVMGVTWLFAILASITDVPVFWYLHLVLNGLQGVFVFTSFALRTSIWKKIKIKFPKFKTIQTKDSTTFYSISGSPTLR